MKDSKPAARSRLSTSTIVWVAAVLVISTAIVAPFFLSKSVKGVDGKETPTVLLTHDMPNHFRYVEQFDQSLRSGVLLPRWFSDVNNGYGNATFVFYPPGFYYLSSLVHLVFNDWMKTLFFLSILCIAGSGLAFYVVSRTFYDNVASMVGSLVYMLMPIHMLDLYWRGGMTQLIGYIFLPVVLYFAYRLGGEGRLRYYAGLGLSYGLHILTHLPVGYLFTYTIAFYALLWAYKKMDWRIAFRIAVGMGIGLLLSAVYWLPAAFETRHVFEAYSDIFPYHYSYIAAQPSEDPFGHVVQVSFYFNIILLLVSSLVIRQIEKSATEGAADPSKQLQTRLWIILCAATIFMTTSYSYFISVLIPKIQIAVPPFRWLAVSCLFTGLVAAAAIEYLRKNVIVSPLRRWGFRIAVVLALAVTIGASINNVVIGSLRNAPYVPQDKITVIDEGFIPKNATRASLLPNTENVMFDPESGAAEILRWDPQHREVAVKVSSPSIMRLKTYNFPGWTARLDGQPVPILSDKDGVQTINVPEGIHKIEVRFENTTPRVLANVISILGLFIIVGIFVYERLKKESRKPAGARSAL